MYFSLYVNKWNMIFVVTRGGSVQSQWIFLHCYGLCRHFMTSGSVMLCRLVLVMFWVVLITRLQSLLLVGVHNLYWVAIPSDKMLSVALLCKQEL